jgi:hypothetical protein
VSELLVEMTGSELLPITVVRNGASRFSPSLRIPE